MGEGFLELLRILFLQGEEYFLCPRTAVSGSPDTQRALDVLIHILSLMLRDQVFKTSFPAIPAM